MINWRRPSNKSNRLTLPFGPSNTYVFSTSTHGILRRSAASASRERVNAFSFTSICWRAASHSCADTTGGFFISCSLFCFSVCCLLVAILFLPDLLFRIKATRRKKVLNLADAHRQNSARRCRSCGDHHCACDTHWAHGSSLSFTPRLSPRLYPQQLARPKPLKPARPLMQRPDPRSIHLVEHLSPIPSSLHQPNVL